MESRPKLRIRKAGGVHMQAPGGARILTESEQEIGKLSVDERLQADMAALPSNYNFEVPKTIWRLRSAASRCVALQLPEGLLAYAGVLGDLLKGWVPSLQEVVILGDVTYGACCVDDYTARRLGADFLVHYGHSCLIPIDTVQDGDGQAFQTLYVFVDIAFDVAHAADSIGSLLPNDRRYALFATIQFAAALPALLRRLKDVHGFEHVRVPQSLPLSRGELLGCTAPTLDPADADHVIYIGDGRFHLEAAQIANGRLVAYRYDPYGKVLSEEGYDMSHMRGLRSAALAEAKHRGALRRGARWGLIQGTLGRQGNPQLVERLRSLILDATGREPLLVLLSEISPAKLSRMASAVDVWVQVACPRLSIDWGSHFAAPLLNPFETYALFSPSADLPEHYAMDYYSKSGGPWSNYFKESS